MSVRSAAPCGSWISPITAGDIARGAVPLGQVETDGEDLYWLEGRPREGGRAVLVRRSADGTRTVTTPDGFNVRTRVHEYGGGSYLVRDGTVWFSNFSDQRLYRQEGDGRPVPVTQAPPLPGGVRYADARLTADRGTLICVRESHAEGREAVNEIVALPADGSGQPRVLVAGSDFYASPRISTDGRRLAWLSWDHPRMPWDGTTLWVAELSARGPVTGARRVAGGEAESVFQPDWGPAGDLHFVSDRNGWWNLYRLHGGDAIPLAPMEAELGVPQWAFGLSTYAFLEKGDIACVYIQAGRQRLGIVRAGAGRVEPLATPLCDIRFLRAGPSGRVAFVGAGPGAGAAVQTCDTGTGAIEVVRPGLDLSIDASFVSEARSIEFPTEEGRSAFALFYPPVNPDFEAPAGERPPLIVMSHGGPTGMASAGFDPGIQYWTSRGFAVVDVNYGGSSGYGRPYRERLKGRWGIVDVDDCLNAARFLADRGEVDARRVAIRGGSAGGFTTLCALTFRSFFAAGASYYGVADLEALARDTHKFESRYLDGLIAPYPAGRELYHERSPIHAVDRISCPVIIFQGLEDRIVPPNQAEAMAGALRRKHLPVAYLSFAGEQHGFRKAETIRRTLEAELYFYSRVFGFTPADAIEPVPIENL